MNASGRRAPGDGGTGRQVASLTALGVRLHLAAEAPGRLAALLARTPPAWIDELDADALAATPDVRLRWLEPDRRCPASRLLRDGTVVAAARRSRDLLDRFEHELLAAVATRAARYVVLHAGAVIVARRAILLPGPSFAGKSTLVHALVAAGATYYSDDLAPLDGRGRVHAVPKRLTLRRAARRGAAVAARRLGWDPRCPPRPVALVAVTRYRPGAAVVPRRLSPGAGAMALFGHALSAAAAPERAFRTAVELASKVPVVATDRGDAEQAASALLDLARGLR